MRTPSRSARPRVRAVIVTLLLALGIVTSAGIGHAQAAAEAPDGGDQGTVCADGKRDDNPADGVCTRDGGKQDGGKQDGGKQDGGAQQDEGDKGTVCADGKRDDNPADGVCTRDGAKSGGDKAGGDQKDGKKDGAAPPPDPNLVAGTPCTKSVEACVDLGAKKAWLVSDGKVTRGPVPIAHGGPGYETPRGTFAVQWKNRDHRSMEFDNAPMPFAVFFTDGGVAFHQGDLNSTSHGCVRLGREDAEQFFNILAVGDEVQVH